MLLLAVFGLLGTDIDVGTCGSPIEGAHGLLVDDLGGALCTTLHDGSLALPIVLPLLLGQPPLWVGWRCI